MDVPNDRDPRWFSALYAAHYPDVVRYGVRRLGGDPEAAADLAQEVFVVTWQRRHQVPDRGLPWLYGVARRLLANRWRHRRAHPDPVPLTHPDSLRQHFGGDQPDSIAGLDGLRAALAALPEIDREILRLVGWEQLTVTEAAAALGCSRTAAAVRLHRARRRLTAALATTAGPPPVPRPAPRTPAEPDDTEGASHAPPEDNRHPARAGRSGPDRAGATAPVHRRGTDPAR